VEAVLNSFFLVAASEMGDKTQLATVALAASFQDVLSVTAGTTLGMMFSDGLAVFLGDRFLKKVPMPWVRRGAAALFAIFGFVILFRGPV
jgi:putative Ca2+/H+ antiporter (TMEM165/GDT1 family)